MNLSFLKHAPAGTARAIQVLAAAESLTDEVARTLYELAPVEGIKAEGFLKALRQASFVEPRNSEWSFTPQARTYFRSLGQLDVGTIADAHSRLLDYAINGDPELAGTAIPSYLFTNGGKAYHSAASGDAQAAYEHYANAGVKDSGGRQWLAAKLSSEQMQEGVIDSNRVETLFIQAIVMFRENQRRESIPIFEKIIEKDEVNFPSAITFSLVGSYIRRSNPIRAETLLKRGLQISDAIGDTHGVAVNCHNLGFLIGNNKSRSQEAEEFFQRSIEIGRAEENEHHVAQVLHSYGVFLRRLGRVGEAELALQEARTLLEAAGDIDGEAQVANTLAAVIGLDPNRSEEAEKLFKRALELVGNRASPSVLIRKLFNYGTFLAKLPSRRGDAESVLRRALEIAETANVKNDRYVAQALRELSLIVETSSVAEAEELLRAALKISTAISDNDGIGRANKALARLANNNN
jgi:tetratricopeptide (TPR) repeat protein